MNHRNKNIFTQSKINTSHNLREGESIEQTLRRITASGEVIETDASPEIFQERNAGVDPLCDIRTDKMEMAQAAFDKVTRTHLLARANKDDFGKKELEDFSFVTDENGNIVENKHE